MSGENLRVVKWLLRPHMRKQLIRKGLNSLKGSGLRVTWLKVLGRLQRRHEPGQARAHRSVCPLPGGRKKEKSASGGAEESERNSPHPVRAGRSSQQTVKSGAFVLRDDAASTGGRSPSPPPCRGRAGSDT